jgi:hypothetical protein
LFPCAQVNASIGNHLQELPELTAAVKYEVIPSGARDELTGKWKSWVEEAGGCGDNLQKGVEGRKVWVEGRKVLAEAPHGARGIGTGSPARLEQKMNSSIGRRGSHCASTSFH